MDEGHFMTKQQTEQKSQLEELARNCQKHWNTEENLFLIELAGTPEQYRKLERADALYRSVEMSLRFKQYRRAVWYLTAYQRLCQNLFSSSVLENARKMIAGWIEC